MSGVTRQSYAPEIRIIRVMCTGRVDLAFILRAFRNGADGVILAGCWPGECHYVTEGNYDALGSVCLARKLLERVGVSPERLRLEWIATSEATRFAEVMSDFAAKLHALGPIGPAEGIDARRLRLDLGALGRLVPYLKLVEREKLRVPVRSEKAYRAFYESEETGRLLRELIDEKLAVCRILSLLEEGALPAAEISQRLGLSASEVSRHMNSSSRQGLVRYDLDRKRYALACATRAAV